MYEIYPTDVIVLVSQAIRQAMVIHPPAISPRGPSCDCIAMAALATLVERTMGPPLPDPPTQNVELPQ